MSSAVVSSPARARRHALAALMLSCLVLLIAAPPSRAAQTVSYRAQFAVDDVDPWGAAGVHRANQSYDVRWNESGYASDKESVVGLDFGGSIGGATAGHLGIDFGYDAANGKLDVDYPALVDVSYPEDETYFPGDTIRIRTTDRSSSGSFDFDPGTQDYSITGSLAVSASASAELCFVDCFGTINFFPPISVPETSVTMLNAHANSGQYGDIWNPPAGSGATHVTGDVNISRPDVSLDVAEQGRMFAESTKSFMDVDVDVDAFSKTQLGRSFSQGGVDLSYDILDGRVHLNGEEKHSFDFAPQVRVSFAFPRSISYRVVNADGTFAGGMQVGVSAVVDAGQSIDIVVPVDQTQPFTITPTLSLANTMQHKLQHVYQVQGNIKILHASASIPSWDVLGVEVFPGISFGIGPVYSTSVPITTTRPELTNRSWSVVFAPHVQAARAFDPENIPVANAGGPYDVNEGSSIDLDGTGSYDLDADDKLTYAWVLDGPGSIEASGSTPQFDGLDGEHVYVATLKVCDLKLNCHSDTAEVRVHNVAPSHVLDTTSTIAFGVGQGYLARIGVPVTHAATANDVGTDDTTYTWTSGAFATWTPATSAYFNDGVAADPRISAHGVLPFATSTESGVTYSQPGVFTQVLVVNDDDAGSTTTSVPVLVADGSTTYRSYGWFKQQYSLKGQRVLSAVQLDAYLAFTRAGSSYFAERQALSNADDAYAVLQRLDTKGSTVFDQTCALTLTAWLNIASGAVAFDRPLPARMQVGARKTAADALREVEQVLASPTTTPAQLLAAMQLARAIGS